MILITLLILCAIPLFGPHATVKAAPAFELSEQEVPMAFKSSTSGRLKVPGNHRHINAPTPPMTSSKSNV